MDDGLAAVDVVPDDKAVEIFADREEDSTSRCLGEFKSFLIQSDKHLLTVMRDVERNPVQANFVDQAENWQWGSAHARQQPADQRLWLATPSDPPRPRQ